MKILETDQVTEPGAYRMLSGAYHRDPVKPAPSLSSGLARKMLSSTPLHVWTGHPRLNPSWAEDVGTDVTRVGSVAHRILLGAGSEFIELPFEEYRSKEAKAARDEVLAQGKVPIKSHQLERAALVAEAAREQLPAEAYREGETEIVIAARFGLTWLRAMLDGFDGVTVRDYKTTNGLASEDAATAQIARMGFDVQAAFYLHAIGLAFPELAGRLRFVFDFQESKKLPYALASYEVSEGDLAVAHRKVEEAIGRWAECIAAKQWPGYHSGVKRITLPDWHTRKWLDAELAEDDESSASWKFSGSGR